MFCSQRCASKGVIRCTAPALYLENASESAESRKFSHFHSKHLRGKILRLIPTQLHQQRVDKNNCLQKSNFAVDYSIKDMLGKERVTNPAAVERQMGLCLHWCAIYKTSCSYSRHEKKTNEAYSNNQCDDEVSPSGATMAGRGPCVTSVWHSLAACTEAASNPGSVYAMSTGEDCCVTKVRHGRRWSQCV